MEAEYLPLGLPSEYDGDLGLIQQRYRQLDGAVREDDEISEEERRIQKSGILDWYGGEKQDLLHGDGKSAAILLEAGLARHIEP